ncbi:hypothetical protein BASA50_010916 [Batrachochytrium salamandrivorans]|uniref:HD domain-containing protein n=1 Tax=Batrachochytrium salamandrivorans TaxID=1357716 RepID=A0ABQ8EX21_9FUNG|nr:hypothetical protein BASA60_009915 [Batrachochytrium salamandrivorans]KAH6569470.1 hypothetical protein BASA62_004841 [Batrachochytrium salamandrivorans]KAH6588053.1 hypothetical protein BASA50_010916 [Batrachochytrium salamandrivorans]KAH6591412.1 hypothetical protein BASA61_004923 [Batrachochytrium salamandrivorans]KAH9252670.1 hypothetical protein BASA81_009362 [Batrachochytrium salamandrivorans]
MLQFLHTCERLKITKRTGWVDRGVDNAESIGDHMHRMSIIALLVKDQTIDKNRLVKMAVVHDLAEAVVGDLTPHSGISKAEKEKLERAAIVSFVETNGHSKEILEIQALWEEYEAATTKEALLCKDIDKFEMILQAFEYEKRTGKKLQEFYDSTKGKFTHPEVIALAQALYIERQQDLGFET